MSFIKEVKGDSEIVLKLYTGSDLEVDKSYNIMDYRDSSDYMRICFLDLETDGIDKEKNQIIEIAMKVVQINKHTGKESVVVDSYESFNDPKVPIDPVVTKFNGITDEMVKGHSIDWSRVEEVFKSSDLAVAHNSYFDRAFMDRYIDYKIPWGCSLNDIDWLNRGFTNAKLELLCIWHGFYFGAHRAMNDVDALIHLLIHETYDDNMPIIELVDNARKPYYKVRLKFAFDENKVKAVKQIGGYRWDSRNKEWWKIYKNWDQMINETKSIPDGISHDLDKINSYEKFKNK